MIALMMRRPACVGMATTQHWQDQDPAGNCEPVASGQESGQGGDYELPHQGQVKPSCLYT